MDLIDFKSHLIGHDPDIPYSVQWDAGDINPGLARVVPNAKSSRCQRKALFRHGETRGAHIPYRSYCTKVFVFREATFIPFIGHWREVCGVQVVASYVSH